jgi:phage terminase Nu1 subunit (DNA packaging protein)
MFVCDGTQETPCVRLNRAELARAFNVALTTIDSWVVRECPRISAGGPGVPSVFDWEDVAYWVHMYKIGPDYSDPDEWIRASLQRARKILAAREKRKTHG